ncbi:MAG: hypothetical protein LBI82_01915 [Dysgonamonadaceae bacterium]|nr:hypothetical protein [Dysgonamonadaceae bacterium]
MKKVFFIMLVAAFSVASVNAQECFKKGDKTLSGRLTGLDFQTNDFGTSVNFGIDGSYFIMDKLAVTAGVGLFSYTPDGGDNSTNIDFTVGARYYVWDALFAGAAYKGFKPDGGDLVNALNLQVGYSYYLSDKVFFEPAVFFEKGFGDYDVSTFGLSIGIGINF